MAVVARYDTHRRCQNNDDDDGEIDDDDTTHPKFGQNNAHVDVISR